MAIEEMWAEPQVTTEHHVTGEEDEEGPAGFYIYLFSIYIVIGAVGVVGNAFVVLVMLKSPSLRKRLANLFIINQSLVDGVSSLLLIATYATELARLNGVLGNVSDSTCRWWTNQATLWGGFTTSTYNLLALNMERYLGVVHPILHKQSFTQRKAVAIMAGVWVFGFAYGWLYAVPSSGVLEGYCEILSIWPSVFWQNFFGIVNVAVQFLLPIVIMAYYYIMMLMVLRRKPRVAPSTSGSKPTSKISGVQKKIIKMLLIITMCFAFCWAWNEFLVLLFSFGYTGVKFYGPFFEFTVIMVFVNSCCNPFIYAFKHDEFRKVLFKMLGMQRMQGGTVLEASTGSSVVHKNGTSN